MSEELTGLFGAGSSTSQKSDSDNSIPDGWKSLQNLSSETSPQLAEQHARVNMFYSEFSTELNTGKGRDDLANYIFKHANGDYDINIWSQYDPEDVIDLTIYILDELDRNGPLRGKDVVNYLEEFAEKDGSPDYLESFNGEPQYF